MASTFAGEDDLCPLAEAAAGGDRTALRTLLTVVGPHVLRVVRRVIGSNHPDVEDVAQECAFEVAQAIRRFRRESSVLHFVCRVALHSAMNARRKMRAGRRAVPDCEQVEADEVAGDTGDDMSPEGRATARACVQLARELCDELPMTQAEVLALHCVLGYTMAEVAAICEAPLETVRSRLRAGKMALMSRALSDPRLREFLEDTA
jgi:RNA polymerase sigma-70 factor, ECF subfamily